jgi:hypothetical protein
MDWIKRNLYFLIGSLVALALMGLAGWHLYSKWQLNNDNLGKLDEQYAKLKRLSEQNPHPGSSASGKIDNIKNAKDQQQELRDYIKKARTFFQLCPAIPAPESGKLTSQEFSSALSRTIDQMQHEAAKASVGLPPNDSKNNSYSFSFAAQKESLAYLPSSLMPLSQQLGEVRAICSVLFAAKINSLDNLRRERVSDDDLKGPQTDYLPDKSVTNELAVMTPYEVTFRCFSSELGAVLAGFASSPCGMIIVKTINVEPAPATETPMEAAPAPMAVAQPFVPPPPNRPAPPPRGAGDDAMLSRYGLRGLRGRPRPAPPPQAQPTPQPLQYTPAPANRGGLQVVLDEKQLKVALMLYVVKLAPAK